MDAFIRKFGQASSSSPTGYILPSSHASLIVSILSAGTFFGALSAGYFNESLGRRFSIIAACAVFCFGVILQTAAVNLAMLVVGRFVAGLGMGVVSSTVILYMSEMSPKKIRGAVVSGYQFAITIGLLLAAVTTNYTSTRSGASAYRIPIAIQFIPSTLLVSSSLSLLMHLSIVIFKGYRSLLPFRVSSLPHQDGKETGRYRRACTRSWPTCRVGVHPGRNRRDSSQLRLRDVHRAGYMGRLL